MPRGRQPNREGYSGLRVNWQKHRRAQCDDRRSLVRRERGRAHNARGEREDLSHRLESAPVSELRPHLFEFNDWGRRGRVQRAVSRRFGRETRRHRPCADEGTAALDASLWGELRHFVFVSLRPRREAP